MRSTDVIGKVADVTAATVRRLGDAGGGRGRTVARRAVRSGRRTLAYARGRWEGIRYAAAGRHPDEHVPDDVLADRVRTDLGPVLHRLDLPKVHVTVERHVVTLHGDAGSLDDVRAIVRAVSAVPGVQAVRSALHVGLLPGNSRPSWGRATAAPSPALRRLLDAADRGGVDAERRGAAVAAVLTALRAKLQPHEWRDLAAHLPRDARSLGGRRASRPTGQEDLVTAVADSTELAGPVAAQTVRAVTDELAALAPPVAPALTRVLPADLQPPPSIDR